MKMTDIAKLTELTHDDTGNGVGNNGEDTRLFYDAESLIAVFACKMSKKDWTEMEHTMNHAEMDREHYTVYAWNDSSGYKYWYGNDSNYIMITVDIKDAIKITKTLCEQIKKDAQALYDSMSIFDNRDWHPHGQCPACNSIEGDQKNEI